MKNISHTQSKAIAHLSSAMKHLGVHRLNPSTQMFGFGGLDGFDDLIASDYRYKQLSSYQKRKLHELEEQKRVALRNNEQAVRQIEESVQKTRTDHLTKEQKELHNLKRKAIEIEQEYELERDNILNKADKRNAPVTPSEQSTSSKKRPPSRNEPSAQQASAHQAHSAISTTTTTTPTSTNPSPHQLGLAKGRTVTVFSSHHKHGVIHAILQWENGSAQVFYEVIVNKSVVDGTQLTLQDYQRGKSMLLFHESGVGMVPTAASTVHVRPVKALPRMFKCTSFQKTLLFHVTGLIGSEDNLIVNAKEFTFASGLPYNQRTIQVHRPDYKGSHPQAVCILQSTKEKEKWKCNVTFNEIVEYAKQKQARAQTSTSTSATTSTTSTTRSSLSSSSPLLRQKL